MDLLSQHEAFLRAIFDNPEDDTPRLVYADFLQENGDEDRAEFIRLECDAAQLCRDPTAIGRWGVINLALADLRRRNPEPWAGNRSSTERGFPRVVNSVTIAVAQLLDPPGLRNHVIHERPEFFAAQAVKVNGQIKSNRPLDTLFGLPIFERITELDLSGVEMQDVKVSPEDEVVKPIPGSFAADWCLTLVPSTTTRGVEALAQHPGMLRVTRLTLTHNSLDNDAAIALVNSPYLTNLTWLDLGEDLNRFSIDVWQKVIERFGEKVAG